MGTTLTGTTPQDTYDSLIKVTDNGPLSATAKYLSDGLGNDSALALSTTAVGIGTSSLFAELQINKASDVTLALSNSTAVTSGNRGSLSFYNSAISTVALIKATAVTDNVGTQLEFYTRPAAGSLAQTMTIASTGNVGIGTSAPTSKLSVFANNDTYGLQINTNVASAATTRLSIGSFGTAGAAGSGGSIAVGAVHNHSGSAQSAMTFYTHDGSNLNEVGRFLATGGLTFNGDTAAANALDDYEEGTWTMGIAFGGASVGVTYSSNTGTYTKIGRQVTVNGLLQLTSKGSSTGNATITGLPFTIGNGNSFYSTAALQLEAVTFTNQYSAIGLVNTTNIGFYEATILGVVTTLTNADFSNSSNTPVSFTYFV